MSLSASCKHFFIFSWGKNGLHLTKAECFMFVKLPYRTVFTLAFLLLFSFYSLMSLYNFEVLSLGLPYVVRFFCTLYFRTMNRDMTHFEDS
ncbi:Elongation factor P [Frankliniella fusca]|uniref:Elongation factor P n=1 Tax=Frankliniella fusca TaxID=407009 RepID=A0AAE1GZX8_9NEOP|nr:Elongation factor P [Frankliniella fusca]